MRQYLCGEKCGAVPKAMPKSLFLYENGAQGRNRTTDTAIFSRMLYQLSYLGRRAEALWWRGL